MPTPTDFYPLPVSHRRHTQPILHPFQPFTTDPTPHMIYSRSSGENSQSTTPTLQSPPLVPTPRPNKKGSVSTDIPTGRNRGQTLPEIKHDSTITNSIATR